jgi:GT2 family glycosyltransferase
MPNLSSNARPVSIIIPSYQSAHLLSRFLPSVIEASKQYAGPYEILVVDDHSSDNTQEILAGFKQIQIIIHDSNRGFSASCNTGLSHAKYPIVFFLNTDVELPPDFFQYFNPHFNYTDTFAVTVFGRHYRTGEKLDGGKIGYWKRGNFRITDNYYTEDHPDLPAPYLSFSVQGAYFFADRNKMNELGGFDELFSPFIFEETDLTYRALKRGWRIIYEPRCKALHDHMSTVKSISSERYRKMMSFSNRLIFTWKNIEDGKLLFTHFLFLLIKSIFTPKIYVFQAISRAVKLLPQIMDKRRIEKKEKHRTDQEIFAFFRDYFRQAGIGGRRYAVGSNR